MNVSSQQTMTDKLSYQAFVTWSVVLAFQSVVLIIGNITAIGIFSKRNFVVCKSAYLLINLTIADVLVGLAPLVHLVEIIYTNGSSSQQHCGVLITDISKVYSFFTILASLSCLAVIAVERCFATFKPHRHRLGRRFHYVIIITLSWCLTIVCTTFKGIATCNDGKMITIFTNIMTVLVALCLISIILSYLAIAIKMKFTAINAKSSASFKQNARLSKTLIITTLIAVLFNMPRIFFRLIGSKCEPCQYLLTKNADLASNVILYSNSFANLFIYSLRMPVFRKEFKKAFTSLFSSLSGKVSIAN